jgi:ketosteroid isomerase-like protein
MGRRLGERLALRAPRLSRLFFRAVFALPPGAPLRRRVVKRGARLGWEANARGDDEAALIVCDPHYELNMFGDEFRALGFADRYEGHAGCIEFMRRWRAEWESSAIEVEHVYDLGERIVTRFTTTARGRSSGAEVKATAGSVYYMRDGAVARQDFYFRWADCAAALGLPA